MPSKTYKLFFNRKKKVEETHSLKFGPKNGTRKRLVEAVGRDIQKVNEDVHSNL